MLNRECGHHCGIKDSTEGHCHCPECHGRPPVIKITTNFNDPEWEVIQE